MGINVLSLFDGISCGHLALDRAGVTVDKYYSAEIKQDALKVANDNYPQDKPYRLGDVTKISKDTLPKIDLLIGGSPCQDFSQAHSVREGIKGLKSGLFYEYARLFKECTPKHFLLENVRMKKADQDIITDILGVEPFVINSSKLAPQLRHRLYWTNIPFDKAIPTNNVKLNDILEKGYTDRDYARALLESDSRPLSTPIKMVHRYFNTGFTTLIFKDEQHYKAIKKHFDTNFKGLKAVEIDSLIKHIDISFYDGVRYMTQAEREYCQTLPQGYTKCLTPNKAAGVIGDGWTVDVVAHIFKGIVTA